MAKNDKKDDKKKAQKPEQDEQPTTTDPGVDQMADQAAEARLDREVALVAPEFIQGREYFEREEYVISNLASSLKLDIEVVREKVLSAKKVAMAEHEAALAKAEADRAKAVADSKALEAQNASASMEGKVMAEVPRKYKLNLGTSMVTIKAGVQPLPKAWAEHPYSKAIGVRVVGK